MTDEKTDQRPGTKPSRPRLRTSSATAAALGAGIGSSSTAVAELARNLSRPVPGSTLDALTRASSAAAALGEAVSARQTSGPNLLGSGAADLARQLSKVTGPTPGSGAASLAASLRPSMDELTRKFAATAGPKAPPAWATAVAGAQPVPATRAVSAAHIAGSSSMAGVADIRELTRNMVVPIPDAMKMAGPDIGMAARVRADQLGIGAAVRTAESLKSILAPPAPGGLVDSLQRLKSLASVDAAGLRSWIGGTAPGAASLMPSTVIPKGLSIPRWMGVESGAAALARLWEPRPGLDTDLVAGASTLGSIQNLLSSLRSPLRESMKSWGTSAAITDMMRSWWPLADRGLKHAGAALRAALGAWDALVHGAADAYEKVRNLLLTWLGFTIASDDLVGSAMLALLDLEGWLPTRLLSASAADRDPIKMLRTRILIENRQVTRLSTDPDLRFGGHPLRSLDESIELDDAGTKVTLRDVVIDRAAADPAELDDWAISDPRLVVLWSKLTDRERDLLLEKSSRPHMTWPTAAATCGVTRDDAERLRRKIKHLLSQGLPLPC